MDADPERASAKLGPISPELVLVAPVLAEQARKLLPDVVERPRPRAPVAVVGPATAPESAPVAVEPAVPRRRWRRMLVLAVLVFVAGAISGTLLGGKNDAPVGVSLGVRAEAPDTRSPTADTRSPTVGAQTARPSKTAPQPTAPAKTSPHEPLRPPKPRSRVARGWTSNVLGV